MVLSVLGSLCCLYLSIWLSVFTAPISVVVVWLWSHITPISSLALSSTACVLAHMNSSYITYLNVAFHDILNMAVNNLDKRQAKHTTIFIRRHSY